MSDVGRYRRLYTRLWAHSAFTRLSEGERLVCLYLLTGPQQNRLGFSRLSAAAAAEDLGVSVAKFHRRLRKVCDAFGWKYDVDARVLLIPSWWKFNDVQNPKHLLGCLSDLVDVPDTPLLADFANGANQLPETLRASFLRNVRDRMRNGIGDGIANGMRYQEQEQEQEQEQKTHTPRASRAGERDGTIASSSNTNGNGTSLGQRFKAFWAAYPKHEDEKAAKRAWKRCKPSPALTAQIVAALAWQRQQDSWLRDGGRYVPSPAKWLNGRRWQDEPRPPPHGGDRADRPSHRRSDIPASGNCPHEPRCRSYRQCTERTLSENREREGAR